MPVPPEMVVGSLGASSWSLVVFGLSFLLGMWLLFWEIGIAGRVRDLSLDILRPHGVGPRNDNGDLLLQFAVAQQLTVLNTFL